MNPNESVNENMIVELDLKCANQHINAHLSPFGIQDCSIVLNTVNQHHGWMDMEWRLVMERAWWEQIMADKHTWITNHSKYCLKHQTQSIKNGTKRWWRFADIN